jgi:hypothetical protein
MKSKKCTIAVIALWAVLVLSSWLLPSQSESDSERRPLAQLPTLSGKTILSGTFMDKFEDYTLDQFPLRDSFRSLKALFHTRWLGQKDSNGIYIHHGYAAKMEYPLNHTSVNHALGRFNHLYEKYLTGSKVYMAVVPDKNYYLAPQSGRLSLDYEALFSRVREGMPWAEHIDLTDDLSLEDYYRTDTHWRQENLLKAAGTICASLGIAAPRAEDFTVTELEKPFRGVYCGQSALPLGTDPLRLMESDVLRQCRVYDHETGNYFPVYDMQKLTSKDLYDVYLGGAKALLTIENPNADNDEELIVFRDSFGSSMIPLLAANYAKVTVVDIRYIGIDLLDRFVEFSGQDVLMLYSTLILNSSSAIK